MSWEAVTWASKQRMKLPHEQLILLVLANCADPSGVAFAEWPGREHWWKYLVDRTRLSKSSLFRHINTIIDLGLCARSMLVLADGTRRPTLRLDLSASFDIEEFEQQHSHEREQSHSETESLDSEDDAENANDTSELEGKIASPTGQSHHETSPIGGTGPFPIMGMHKDSSKDCSKESPPTPSGGFARDELWDRFVKAWGEPIPKMALARSAWDHIETAKRAEAVASARGYWAWLKAHPKPPSAQSAQSFIRDAVGWPQWLRYSPHDGSSAAAISSAHPLASREAKAIIATHEIAGLEQFLRGVMIRNGAVNYLRPVTPKMLALADAGPKDGWPVLTRANAAAWEGFLRETVAVEIRKHIKEGDRAPWPWPPSAEGKIYATGPPETLMNEADFADFK